MALPIQPGPFLRHAPADVARWASSLKHVRFCHPADRQVLDREVFEVAMETPDAPEAFIEMCAGLGFAVRRIRPEDAVAQPGVSYSPQEWKNLTFPIPGFPELAQPGDRQIAGVPAHAWVRGRFLEIVIAPAVGQYSVDEDDYRRARAIDELLEGAGLRFREPPRDDDSCVCPKYYPQFWKS